MRSDITPITPKPAMRKGDFDPLKSVKAKAAGIMANKTSALCIVSFSARTPIRGKKLVVKGNRRQCTIQRAESVTPARSKVDVIIRGSFSCVRRTDR